MPPKKVLDLIELLEKVRLRPRPFLGELSAVNYFLAGVRCACIVFGLRIKEGVYHQLMNSRGWDFAGVMLSFRALKFNFNLSDEECVEEILDLEISAWRKSYDIF